MRFLIALIILFPFNLIANEAQETRNYPASLIKKLVVEYSNDSNGDVTIVAALKNEAQVHIRKRKLDKFNFDKYCRFYSELKNGQLKVKVEKIKHGWNKSCKADLNISTPREIDINITLGNGSVDLQQIHGALNFTLGNGKVHSSKTRFKKLEGSMGNGSIDLRGLVGDVDINMGNGKIFLEYIELANKHQANIAMGNGSAVIYLPHGIHATTDLSSLSGRVTDQLQGHGEAKLHIDMSTANGRLILKNR